MIISHYITLHPNASASNRHGDKAAVNEHRVPNLILKPNPDTKLNRNPI